MVIGIKNGFGFLGPMRQIRLIICLIGPISPISPFKDVTQSLAGRQGILLGFANFVDFFDLFVAESFIEN